MNFPLAASASASTSSPAASASSSQASASNSAASSHAAAADANDDEIDFSDPSLLTDLDEFQFETVTVYAPKKFELVPQEDANVAEDDFWRTSSHIAVLVNRKPISYYTEKYASELTDQILSSEEAFQQFMITGAEIQDAENHRVTTDTVNGRCYQSYDSGNKHLVWTILMDDVNTYWIFYACSVDEQDLYHDIMVQLIDKAKIARS